MDLLVKLGYLDPMKFILIMKEEILDHQVPQDLQGHPDPLDHLDPLEYLDHLDKKGDLDKKGHLDQRTIGVCLLP